MSLSQAAQLNGIQNTIPVVLTQSQVNTLNQILQQMVSDSPDDPLVQQLAKLFPQVVQNPKYCTVK